MGATESFKLIHSEQSIDGFPYQVVVREEGKKSFFVEKLQVFGRAPIEFMTLAEYPSYVAAIDAAREMAEIDLDDEVE